MLTRVELRANSASTEFLALSKKLGCPSYQYWNCIWQPLRRGRVTFLSTTTSTVDWSQAGQNHNLGGVSLAFFSTGISGRAVSTNYIYWSRSFGWLELPHQILKWPSQSCKGNQSNVLMFIFLSILEDCVAQHSWVPANGKDGVAYSGMPLLLT